MAVIILVVPEEVTMPRKTPGLLKALRTADDVCKIATGRRLNEVIARGLELFGEDIIHRVAMQPPRDPEEIARIMPYMVLGVNPDAPSAVVKAAWKAQLKDCHPDTSTPDADKAARINNAYDAVCKERGVPK